MFKVEVVYECAVNDKETLHVVVKTVPTVDEYRKNLLNYERVFNHEIGFYTTIIPAMEKVLEAAGEKTKFSPGYIFHCTEPYHVLMMEDISVQGFVMPDELFDLTTTKRIVSKLAKFHAASMVVNESVLTLSSIKGSLFHVDKTDFQIPTELFLPDIKLYRESIENLPGFGALASNLRDFESKYIPEMERIYKNAADKSILAMCHSDFYLKNLMIRLTNSKEIDDILFLDYQLCVWGTPAIDIVYLTYQVGNLETRLQHREEIEKFYYDELASTLTTLGYKGKVVSHEEFRTELDANRAVEIMQIICMYKYRFMKWGVEGIQEKIAQDRSYMTKQVFADPEYLELSKKDLEKCFKDMARFNA